MSEGQVPAAIELTFPADHPQAEQVGEALVRARAATSLVDLYDAWLHLGIARASAAAERARESERLETRAGLMLNSVQAARQLGPQPEERSLAPADELGRFAEGAERELAAAREALRSRAEREERLFAEHIEKLKAALLERAAAVLAHHRPAVVAHLQPVGQGQALFHLERPSGDDAVLLCWLLTGKLPTRHDAFFDDAVDDATLPPAHFYAEEGLADARPGTADAEDAVALDAARRFVPVKGMIAFGVPGREFPRFRLINRGPLAEAEAREPGGEYGRLMSRASAELLAGVLIRLKAEGRIELALKIA